MNIKKNKDNNGAVSAPLLKCQNITAVLRWCRFGTIIKSRLKTGQKQAQNSHFWHFDGAVSAPLLSVQEKG
jgi:hypothetical protein